MKWPGGKGGELDLILAALPLEVDRYFEPFLGGGAVFFAMNPEIPAFVNDASPDLAAFYRSVASGNEEFLTCLENMQAAWAQIENLMSKKGSVLLNIYEHYCDGCISDKNIRLKLSIFVSENVDQIEPLLATRFERNASHFLSEVVASLQNKFARMWKIERMKGKLSEIDVLKNIEGAFKSAYYVHIRHHYNNLRIYGLSEGASAAIFFFVREYAYASMFRFNSKGNFNVPYGGISYNRKDISSKISRLRNLDIMRRLESATFESLDFLDFLQRYPPRSRDFVFVDPPYDSDFSEYDRMVFTKKDQKRLSEWLIKCCKARFMLIIKRTEFILSLYESKGVRIQAFEKKYMWTIKERNDRDVTHLMITNY